MSMEDPREMFVHELMDIYDAENKLLTQLERLEKKASNEQLAALIRDHREETDGQIERLDDAFEALDEKPKRQPCKGMNGLIEELTTFVKEEKPDEELLNVYIAGACIKVEHYEIASYESMIAMANQLGLQEVAELLEENLQEERNALQRLQELSQDLISQLPAHEQFEEEEVGAAGNGKRNNRTR